MRPTLDPRHVAMAQKIACGLKRRLPRSVQFDDVQQAAMLGLWKAVSKHPAGEGPGYEVYLRMRIRGAIIDELRAQDWLPRRARKAADTNPLDYLRVVHLEDIRTSTGQVLELRSPVEWEPEEDLTRAELAELAWSTPLPDRDQRIMRAAFARNRRHLDIAIDEGVSEPRISQLVVRSLQRMRRHMAGETEGPEATDSSGNDEAPRESRPGPDERSTDCFDWSGCVDTGPMQGEVGHTGDIRELLEYPCNCDTCRNAT